MAVSSIRPFRENSKWERNQLRSFHSWESLFDRIFYFGEPEEKLETGKTFFIPFEGRFPQLKLLVALASTQEQLVAIVNADIVLNPKLLQIPRLMHEQDLLAVASRRFSFDPEMGNTTTARLEEKTADFFMANPIVWSEMLPHVPDNLLFGQNQWDSWVTNFFLGRLGDRRFKSITNQRCVFHPKHEDRIRVEIGPVFNHYPMYNTWPSEI